MRAKNTVGAGGRSVQKSAIEMLPNNETRIVHVFDVYNSIKDAANSVGSIPETLGKAMRKSDEPIIFKGYLFEFVGELS